MGGQAMRTTDEGYSGLNERYFDQSIHFLHDWYKEMLAYS